jgi:hypothetical protein
VCQSQLVLGHHKHPINRGGNLKICVWKKCRPATSVSPDSCPDELRIMNFFVGDPANHFHDTLGCLRRITCGFQNGRCRKCKRVDEFRL